MNQEITSALARTRIIDYINNINIKDIDHKTIKTILNEKGFALFPSEEESKLAVLAGRETVTYCSSIYDLSQKIEEFLPETGIDKDIIMQDLRKIFLFEGCPHCGNKKGILLIDEVEIVLKKHILYSDDNGTPKIITSTIVDSADNNYTGTTYYCPECEEPFSSISIDDKGSIINDNSEQFCKNCS